MVASAEKVAPQKDLEKVSIIATASIGVVLTFAAWLSYRNQWLLALAFSVGGLGGLVHEVAQSRGKILFFRRQSDGLYLGAIAGVILGAVAGLLVIRGYLTGDTATTNATFVQMSYEIFLAGLALKGIAEAAGTGDQSQPGSPELTITDVVPKSEMAGETVHITNLKGKGFQKGALVELVHGDERFPAENVNVEDSTKITCTIKLPGKRQKWDIVVTNPNNEDTVLKEVFETL